MGRPPNSDTPAKVPVMNISHLIQDIRRVCNEAENGIATRLDYMQHGKYSIWAVTKRYGGWRKCLHELGIAELNPVPSSRSKWVPQELTKSYVKKAQCLQCGMKRDFSWGCDINYDNHSCTSESACRKKRLTWICSPCKKRQASAERGFNMRGDGDTIFDEG